MADESEKEKGKVGERRVIKAQVRRGRTIDMGGERSRHIIWGLEGEGGEACGRGGRKKPRERV